jgi:hypothetical protein
MDDILLFSSVGAQAWLTYLYYSKKVHLTQMPFPCLNDVWVSVGGGSGAGGGTMRNFPVLGRPPGPWTGSFSGKLLRTEE